MAEELSPPDLPTEYAIPSDRPHPVRPGPRYTISATTLDQLETLSRSRFELGGTLFESIQLDPRNAGFQRSIAMSVFASSDIEGEGFGAENLEPYVAAITEPGERVDAELSERQQTFNDQVRAYFWAFNQSGPLTVHLIQEIHARMFRTAKPDLAGKLKSKEVVISYRQNGQQVRILAIPSAVCEEYLNALCERWNAAVEHAGDDRAALLAIAEFHCDFLAIHPFADGNGRTGRLLVSMLMQRSGFPFTALYPLDQVVLDTRRGYYDALMVAQQNWHTAEEDLTPWIAYFVDAVFEQWERAMRRVRRASSE